MQFLKTNGPFVLLVLGAAAVVAATLLPGNGIEWAESIPPRWCLRCGGLWLTDGISNVLLFMPFGAGVYMLARAQRLSCLAALALSAAAGFALSLFVETSQALGFPPARSAALADVVANSFGAMAGTLFAMFAPILVTARGRLAGALALSWALLASLVLLLTWAAIGPRGNAVMQVPGSELTSSTLTHVPGHPWYEAPNDSAVVNGFRAKRGWGGPIIIASPREGIDWNASVAVRGFDPLGSRIPLLFVHMAGDSSAMLMIAEHGRDAELVVTRRAWDWGVALPVLRLKNVFAGRSPQDQSTLVIHAVTSRNELRMWAESGGVRIGESHLRFTPLMGWAMLQTLVEVDSTKAPIVLIAWLAVLLGPIAWWSWRWHIHREQQTKTAPVEKKMKSSRILFALFAVDGLLIIAYIFGLVVRGEPFVLFDLDAEANLPTWWSSAKFTVAATSFGLLTLPYGRSRWSPWLFLVVFAALGADEVAGFHERIGHLLAGMTQANTDFPRMDAFLWPVFLGLPIVITGSLLLKRLASEKFISSKVWRSMIIALAVFFSGSVGAEIITFNPWLTITPNSVSYHFMVLLEEGMEQIGASILMWASLQNLLEHRKAFSGIER